MQAVLRSGSSSVMRPRLFASRLLKFSCYGLAIYLAHVAFIVN